MIITQATDRSWEALMIRPVIKGAARDVSFADLGHIDHAIGRLLLATDGSEPAVRATQYAILLARLLQAHITAVHVDTGLDELTFPAHTTLEEAPSTLDPAIRGLLIATDLARLNGVECSVEIVKGGIASSIVRAAERHGAGVIVLGDTGRTGLRRIALGSVAEAVVKASTIPVVVVKAS